MKKLLLSVFALGLVYSASAQCTPDGTLIPDAFGVYPDTTQNFAIAEVGTPYSQVLHFKAPVNAGDIDPQYNGATINSFTVTGVVVIPPGLSYACNISSCQYSGGSVGCAAITGTPTTVGTYEITISITANLAVPLIGNINVPQTFEGYRIHVVAAGTASIAPNMNPELMVYPNPVQDELTIDNLNQFSNVGSIRIVNVEGKLIESVAYNGDASMNINTEALVAGVYFIEIAHAAGIERVKFMKK
jgi:hypothetical protein